MEKQRFTVVFVLQKSIRTKLRDFVHLRLPGEMPLLYIDYLFPLRYLDKNRLFLFIL